MFGSLPYPITGSPRDTSLANSLDNPKTLEDQRIRQAQNGNLDAFNELVLMYQDRVFRQAFWMLNDEASAEDACQEVFLHAYQKIGSFHGGSFRAWLLRITHNICVDQLRSAGYRPTEPLEAEDEAGEAYEAYWLRDPSDTPEQAVEQSELADNITASIQRLDWGFRLPIILVDLQDLDYEEASKIMHIPVGTLKSRLSRARKKLCTDFQKNHLIGLINYSVN